MKGFGEFREFLLGVFEVNFRGVFEVNFCLTMPTSWADSVAAADNAAAAAGASSGGGRSAYVPPHLRNRPPPSSEPPVLAHGGPSSGNIAPAGNRWAAPRNDYGRSGYSSGGGGGGGRGGGWNNRSGGWDRGSGRDREVNPFGDDEGADVEPVEQENTGINFDAYEDIPVETSGDNVPPPVNTFAEIDLGDALNKNIRRCKYVKPTPVQRYAIPISLANRDLMACAQTGSGKTAAFCFPIISGIMTGQFPPRAPHMSRTACPLALILSPTRELSIQVRVFSSIIG